MAASPIGGDRCPDRRGLLGSPSMLSRRFSPSAVVLALLLVACGAKSSRPDYPTAESFPPSAHFEPHRAEHGPEIDALAARFYGEGEFDREALERDLASLLERYPGNATLHEMAAELALLRGDVDERWSHLMMATADVTSPFAGLYLHQAMDQFPTVSQQMATIELLDELRTAHPDPAAREVIVDNLIWLLKKQGELERARALTAELGRIDRFLIVGAFDNDQGKGFLERYTPEEGIDVDAPMQGVLRQVEWREAAMVDDRARIALGDMITPARFSVAYLVTWVRSPEARDAQLRLSTQCPTRAWINGAMVASEENLEGGDVDDIVVPVHLEAGWNALLIKSAQRRTSGWRIGVRLTDHRGASLDDLEISTTPHGHTGEAAEGPAEVGDDHSLPSALSEVQPLVRRKVLESYYRDRSGREEPALEAAQAAREAAPQNPVTLYRAAMAHWDHGEMGRAADILNEGVDIAGQWAHAFQWKRGRFYSQRDRYDRATEDLMAAIEGEPNARLARSMLAQVLDQRGFSEDRCRVLEELLERWPDSARAHRLLGACMNDRGYIDQAEESFRRAHALEPGDIYTLGWLAHFDRLRGRWDQAIQMRDRAREIAPEEGVLVVDAADTRREAGRRGEAKQLYASVLENDPDWARPWERIAMMAFEDGNTESAVDAWKEALERNPDDSLLAERIDFYQAGEGDGFRDLMPSEEEIESAIAEVDQMTPHPGAHTIWAFDDEVTVVRQDGSAQRMITQVMKALTTDGRDALIRQEVPPNARILSAYVRAPDGARQEASSIRGGTVRFRRLEVGSTVVLSYVYESSPQRFLPNQFVSDWWFSGFHRQVRRARWVLLLPPHRSLSTHILGDIAHDASEYEGMTKHVFVAENVDPFVPEQGMLPPNDLLWHVSVSTLGSWDEYVGWERALLSEVFRGDAQLAALAARLTEGMTDTREKFDALYRFVAQEIRYQQDYENSIAGVRPHSCPIVLERGYGDCKDKAVLLIRLAQEAGIEVNFAILRTRPRGRVEREVPNQQFNHAIVYVPAQEGIAEGFFMDPTTDGLDMGNLRQDDQGATSLVLDPRTDAWEFREIPYQSPEMRYTNHEIEVNVTGRDAATAEVTIRARGDHAAALRRAMRNEEEATIVYQNIGNGLFDGSRVTESGAENAADIVSPLEIHLNLDVSDSISPEGEAQRMQVPQVTPLRGMTRLERRRTPMYLGPPFSRSLDITYHLPAGARIVRVPDDVEVEHECFEVTQHTRRRGRNVNVVTRYVQRCPEVSIEQYPEYRQRAQRAAAALESAVVFTVP